MKKLDKNSWKAQKEPKSEGIGVEIKPSKKQKEVLNSIRDTIEYQSKKDCIALLNWIIEKEVVKNKTKWSIWFLDDFWNDKTSEELYNIWKLGK